MNTNYSKTLSNLLMSKLNFMHKSKYTTSIRSLLIFLAVLLNGCVMIPYETPEALENIRRDLQIDNVNILGVTETNWCAYNYGDIAACKATQGLGVLTENGLTLALYKSKKYHHAFTIPVSEIRCTHTFTTGNSPEIFYAFTDTQAFMLAPITPSGGINIPMKIKIYNQLNSLGATKLTGSVPIAKETSKKQYSGSMIMVGTTPVPYVTSSNVYVTINPCKA